jgi:hypothetical protein
MMASTTIAAMIHSQPAPAPLCPAASPAGAGAELGCVACD